MEDLMLDIFNSDAFSAVQLSQAIRNVEYVPGFLGSLNMFEPRPLRTLDLAVEMTDEVLTMIDTSPRGAPPRQTERDDRNIRNFRTVRLPDSFTIYAHELQGIRPFGEVNTLMQIQDEWSSRNQKILRNMELTEEHHRLGAIQGKLLDADGTSVIYDYFAEFGIAEPAAVQFALNDPTANLRMTCHELVRDVVRSGKGAVPQNAQIVAICGDEFYDKFITHAKVERQFENWSAAMELSSGRAWESFEFGKIRWENYRGTDDNSTVAVPTAEARFFPVNGVDVFVRANSPAEFFPFVNTPGEQLYQMSIIDRDRQAYVKGEIYNYPLYMCSRPAVLRTGTIAP